MKRLFPNLLIISALLFTALPAFAVLPDEVLADAALEARARALSKEFRCVVCQNQSIDDSNAPLARDMRVLVRERLTQGDTDKQVREYLVTRYGNFVLLRPPVQSNTIFLWFGPLIFLGAAIFAFTLYLRNPKTHAMKDPAPLTEDEIQHLAQIDGDAAQ